MDTRRPLRWLRAWALEWLGSNARAARQLDGTRAAVLMYHRVLPREQARRRAIEPGMYVTPETFARHLAWLEKGFQVLPLGEIVERLASARSLPQRACAISFDDGWRDNYDHALPALVARKLPATVFVVTQRIGTLGAFWPDEVRRRLAAAGHTGSRALAAQIGAPRTRDPDGGVLQHLKSLPADQLEAGLAALRAATPATDESEREILDWQELEELMRGGIDIESHGATHALLSSLEPTEVGRELCDSLAVLRSRGMARYGLLAYPSGRSDPGIRRLAAEAGYRGAFTTEPGLAGHGSDALALPRLGLHEDVSRSRAEFRLAVARTTGRLG